MAYNRRSKFKAGSLSPDIVEQGTGLAIGTLTGKLNATYLVEEKDRINQRVTDLFWKDPVTSKETLGDLGFKSIEDYRPGEAYYSLQDQQVYIFVPDINSLNQNTTYWQPQIWIDAARTEAFIPVPVGFDSDALATKAYVRDEILNLIGGAPEVLDTIYELADALNNNPDFATDVFAAITDVDDRKYNKDEVYTKQEADHEHEIIDQRIDLIASTQRRVAEYVIGADYSDATELDTFYLANSADSTTFQSYLIRDDYAMASPQLLVDHSNKFFTGLDGATRPTIPKILIAPETSNSFEDFITFSNLQISHLTSSIDPNVTASTVYFKDCLIETSEDIDLFNENLNYIFENCQLLLTGTASLNIGLGVKVLFTNTKLSRDTSRPLIIASSLSETTLVNCELFGYSNLLQQATLHIYKSQVEIDSNTSCFNLTSQDYSNNLYSYLSLENVSFLTPNGYTASYVDGSGKLNANLNVIDISAPNKFINVAETLNDNAGMLSEHFYMPLGYEHFFYNDERAQDVIANMITSSTLTDTVFSWDYNDDTAQLSLALNISSAKLSDSSNLAYKNISNDFTAHNTFTSATITSLEVVSATITNLTSLTKPQNDSSTSVATTQYVDTALAVIQADLEDLEYAELKDVSISQPNTSHVVVYDPTATTIASRWSNRQLDSFDLADSSSLVREGDHVFRLDRLDRPSRVNQSGAGLLTGGYTSTNQVLSWNGQPYDILGTLTKGPGKWQVSLSNDLLLKASQETRPEEQATMYDGWGKVALAWPEEVEAGSSSNKAVVPSYLYQYYARDNAENINPNDYKEALGLPVEGSNYLVWDHVNNQWINTSRTLFTYRYEYINPVPDLNAPIPTTNASFYNVASRDVLPTILHLDSDAPDGVVIKVRRDSAASKAAVSIAVKDLDAVIVTHDNEIITFTTDGIDNFYPQIDLTVEGHTVLFQKATLLDGTKAWYAFGYYYNSANQSMPTPELIVQPESIQDAVSTLFDHPGQDDAIAIYYDDVNARIESRLVFATQAQVNAGVVSNLPVAPDTLNDYVSNLVSTATADVITETDADLRYLAKDSNLSDLTDKSIARANLQLTLSAITDLGFTNTRIPYVASGASLIPNQALIFDGNGIVSTTMSLGGGGISDPATTEDLGVVKLAKTDALDTNNTDVLTPSWLFNRLNTQNDTLAALIASLAGGLVYQAKNATFLAKTGHYYSLSTIQGSYIVNLPSLATVPIGTRIEFKYRNQLNDSVITITAQNPDTIDLTQTTFVLDSQDQHIAFVAGIDANWELA